MERSKLIKTLIHKILSLNFSHPVRVGIDGIMAAGKTTLAHELTQSLLALGVPVIESTLEGFHLPKEIRYKRGRFSPEGYYFDSFNCPALVSKLLAPLGPKGDLIYQKAVFNLYVFENFSHQEIANALGISVGTSKSNLAKARANLKKILKIELDKKDAERSAASFLSFWVFIY